MNEYQTEAFKFACYKDSDYPFFALAEEVGELLGKIAKAKRGDKALETIKELSEYRDGLKKELGDVLWQLSACCNEIGFSLEDIAQSNLDKLSDRKKRGVIKGSGDNR